jgi:hypothetical protein
MEQYKLDTKKILSEIEAERNRQIELNLGGNTENFDKTNTANDWIAYINAYIGRAARKVFRNEKEKQDFRTNMIKAGALIVAALEADSKGYLRVGQNG